MEKKRGKIDRRERKEEEKLKKKKKGFEFP